MNDYLGVLRFKFPSDSFRHYYFFKTLKLANDTILCL